MPVESKRDYSISLLRMIATLCIIICHLMQCLSMELAWWFNVAVEVFIVMSGFLYGQKGIIDNSLQFYRKNILKILVDYYVVIIPVLLIYALVSPQMLTPVLAIKVLLTLDTVSGGEHLWYVLYCILFYLATPLISRYFEKYRNRHIVLYFLLLSVSVVLITEGFFPNSHPARILCYPLGYFLGVISTMDNRRLYKYTSVVIVLLMVLLNSLLIVFDYVLNPELSSILNTPHPNLYNYGHAALGAALFIILKEIFSGIFHKGYPQALKKLCRISDKYSYDIYLVHWFVIVGYFLLKQSTEIDMIGIIGIFAVTFAGAVLVNLISCFLRRSVKLLKSISV